MPHLYILKSVGHPEQIYIGVTGDLGQRMDYHNTGRCSHTSKFMPWQVAYTEQFDTKADALKRERQIKKWSRTKKDALVAGDMVELKKLAKRRKF
jgi:putative endonuclease